MSTKYLNLRFKFGIMLKSFEISKLGKTYAVPSLGNDLVELKNDMDICNISLLMHDGDTIDIYVCHDTILEDVGPIEDLGLDSSSSFPSSERVENDGLAGVQQETDDGYSSIDWTDTEEEVEPTVQQGTKPSIQEEVEPSAQENAEEDIKNDSICSSQSIDYGSDVHEELRIVKEDVRKFRESTKRKKKEKTKGFLGEVVLDGSDEEEPVSDNELEGRSLRGRKKSNRVMYDSTCDVVIWQCGLVSNKDAEDVQNWMVIGIESKLTWKWFMAILQDDLNLGDGSQITIISDMQKGLIVAADEVFPECVLDTY
ncbi:hypothetical protein KY284_035612 [Solanum tuberosum]|nr:hypothetical protein KY284_035612 [Solanum tuberosum]